MDMALAVLHANGAPPSFEAVYERELEAVWRYVRRLGVAERDIEDLVHDTFVVAHRRYDAFDGAAPPRPWLFGIAFRVVAHYHRRARVRGECLAGDDEDLVADPQEGPEAALESKRATDRLQVALGTLPFEQRAVFVLHDIEERSMPEIVTMLQVPASTLYSRLRLARERLARIFRGWRTGGDRP
jgi:RNA polymerase sigma-70 factor, ECF subfamily